MDNIKKIINDCTKIINNKPLTNQHLIDSILTNYPTDTVYLFKMDYDRKNDTYYNKNKSTIEFRFNTSTNAEIKYTNSEYKPVNCHDMQFVMKPGIKLTDYLNDYTYYSPDNTTRFYEYVYDKYNKEHYDYYTRIGEKLCLYSVAKFKEYCAENNLKIKVKNNCTKYLDFPNASIKFP